MELTYKKSKKYSYDWEAYEGGDKNAKTIIEEILSDPELPELEEIVIGCWGESWDNDAGAIIEGIVANREKFVNVRSLFVGDMEYDECEVSWIEQTDYGKLWEALPQLEKLTIKGSTNLSLGKIKHAELKSLEIICGGLPVEVIQSIRDAQLPELRSLRLYIGVEDYGFDGGIPDIEELLAKSNFPNLETLALMDSEIQDEITEAVLKSNYIDQIGELDLSYGSLTDKGGELLLKEIPAHTNIRHLNLEYHFMSDEMMEKLEGLALDVNVEDQQEEDEYDGEVYRWPMLTE